MFKNKLLVLCCVVLAVSLMQCKLNDVTENADLLKDGSSLMGLLDSDSDKKKSTDNDADKKLLLDVKAEEIKMEDNISVSSDLLPSSIVPKIDKSYFEEKDIEISIIENSLVRDDDKGIFSYKVRLEKGDLYRILTISYTGLKKNQIDDQSTPSTPSVAGTPVYINSREDLTFVIDDQGNLYGAGASMGALFQDNSHNSGGNDDSDDSAPAMCSPPPGMKCPPKSVFAYCSPDPSLPVCKIDDDDDSDDNNGPGGNNGQSGSSDNPKYHKFIAVDYKKMGVTGKAKKAYYCAGGANLSTFIIVNDKDEAYFHKGGSFQSTGQKVKDLYCGQHQLLVTDSNSLLVNGLNDEGQLGLGHTNKQNSLKPVTKPNGLTFKSKQVAASIYHSLVVTTDNDLYVFGNNASSREAGVFGILGLGGANVTVTSTPTKIVGLQNKVSQVATDDAFSVAVTTDNNLFATGTCSYFSGDKKNCINIDPTDPFSIPFNPTFKEISALRGKAKKAIAVNGVGTLVITTDGGLMFTGNNRDFKFDLGSKAKNEKDYEDFVSVPLPPGAKIKSLSSSIYGTVILTTDNKIYVVGKNSQGGFGLGHKNEVTSWTEVTLPLPLP